MKQISRSTKMYCARIKTEVSICAVESDMMHHRKRHAVDLAENDYCKKLISKKPRKNALLRDRIPHEQQKDTFEHNAGADNAIYTHIEPFLADAELSGRMYCRCNANKFCPQMRTMRKDGLICENIAALFSPYTNPANDPLYKNKRIARFPSKQLICKELRPI